jgi:hypothetical protein
MTLLLPWRGKICVEADLNVAQAEMNPHICLQCITYAAENAHSQQFVRFVALM